MMDKQMDMTLFHAWLWDETADDQLIVALRKMLVIEDPEPVVDLFREFRLGVWSGWSL